MAIKQNKALSFLNVYAPTQNGGKKRIGFIMLEDGNAVHEAVEAAILRDGIEAVMRKLIVEHNVPGTADDDVIAL